MSRFDNAIFNQNPYFIDVDIYNYQIDNQSPAKNKASKTYVDLYPVYLNFDLKQESRIIDSAPDIGAYEVSVD